MAEEQSVNIGVVNPEAMIIEDDDGSVVIDFQPGGDEPQTVPFGANLAEFMDPADLNMLADELVSAFEEDKASRGEWGGHLHRWTGPTWR